MRGSRAQTIGPRVAAPFGGRDWPRPHPCPPIDALIARLTSPLQSAVLAKRRTAEMQLQAEDKQEKKAHRADVLARKAKRQRHMVIPSVATVPHERRLRRVATKGVVALFNAVRKYQMEQEEVEKAASRGQRKAAPAAVAAMQAASRVVGDVNEERERFMGFLKETTAKETAPAPARAPSTRPPWLEEGEDDDENEFGTFEEL